MFAPELSTSAIDLRPSRNCQTSGGAAGAVKPAARQGRSEAEWLDRAEDRRTIRRRDGRIGGHQVAQRENLHETNETRGLEDRQEVTVGDRLRR